MRRTRACSGIASRVAASRRKRGETTSKSVAIPLVVTLLIVLMLVITFTVVILERMRRTRAFSGIASRIAASRRKRGETTSKSVAIPLVVALLMVIMLLIIITLAVVVLERSGVALRVGVVGGGRSRKKQRE